MKMWVHIFVACNMIDTCMSANCLLLTKPCVQMTFPSQHFSLCEYTVSYFTLSLKKMICILVRLGLCISDMLPDDAELMGLDLTLKAIFLCKRLLKLEDGDQNM